MNKEDCVLELAPSANQTLPGKQVFALRYDVSPDLFLAIPIIKGEGETPTELDIQSAYERLSLAVSRHHT